MKYITISINPPMLYDLSNGQITIDNSKHHFDNKYIIMHVYRVHYGNLDSNLFIIKMISNIKYQIRRIPMKDQRSIIELNNILDLLYEILIESNKDDLSHIQINDKKIESENSDDTKLVIYRSIDKDVPVLYFIPHIKKWHLNEVSFLLSDIDGFSTMIKLYKTIINIDLLFMYILRGLEYHSKNNKTINKNIIKDEYNKLQKLLYMN